jgi:hypothetical protein
MPGSLIGRLKSGYEPHWLLATVGCTLAVRRPGGRSATGRGYDACDEARRTDDGVESMVPSRRCSQR